MQKVIIGVDAGGSKTKTGLIDENIQLIYSYDTESGSPAVVQEKAFDHIQEGLDHVIDYANKRYKVCAIAIGVSGLGVVRDKTIYEKRFFERYQIPILIENDAMLALYSIVKDIHEEGVVILSGTGSAVMGIKHTKTRLVEGWGHLLSEAGSAYAIVRDAIRLMVKTYEETDTISDLARQFMDHLGYQRIEELKVFMYHGNKKEVASYAKFFHWLADNHHPEAVALFKKAASDLAYDVKNVFKSLQLSSKTVLGFRGGLIVNSPLIQDELCRLLACDAIAYQRVDASTDPIFGAYYMIKRLGMLC